MEMKKTTLSLAAALLLATMPSLVMAETTVQEEEVRAIEEPSEDDISIIDKYNIRANGSVVGTYGVYTQKGSSHNPNLNPDGTPKVHSVGDAYREQVNAKLFLNGDLGETGAWHAELQYDGDYAEIVGYRGPRNNSQFEWLRELYADVPTMNGDLTWRIGKQQVVWGKADGVKFLDIINPTDYRYWGQDSMENSRIPLWMVNAEYLVNDSDSVQLVYVPQVNVVNQIPGLYDPETGDQGQPFVPMGMDTLFGQYNGFYNIAPQMGMVAGAFSQTFQALLPAFSSMMGNNILQGFNTMTVSDFTQIPNVEDFLQSTNMMVPASGYVPNSIYSLPGMPPVGTPISGDQLLVMTAGGVQQQAGKQTNLIGSSLNTANPTSIFDYMGDTSFATFNSFQGMQTRFVNDLQSNDGGNGNIGLRYSGSTDSGLNYTFNYYYHYENNPVIQPEWQDAAGQTLTAVKSVATSPYGNEVATMNLQYADGTQFNSNGGANPAFMAFVESQNKINTFGTSFDYAIDTALAPVILRGEFVYDKDSMVPVVDLGKLAYGDFVGAFQNENADFFNYVIGLDITVMTNLFVSFQFMDKWNLDYVDENVQYAGNTQAYSKHTANPATMSMSNNFEAAQEHQIMYTLFLSKPFLQQENLRINNLFLYEDIGGIWNRFDLEYTYTDDVIFAAAYNYYGDSPNSTFGQFADMSNAQVSVKLIF
jgi:hypothetical protein